MESEEAPLLIISNSTSGADRQMKDRDKKFRVPFLGKVRAENLLLLFTLIAVILGTFIGLVLNPLSGIRSEHISKRHMTYLKFPGDMFMRCLRMLIVPMVIASNISSIASMNAKAARLLTALSLIYYISTTVMAVALGLLLVMVIQPGSVRPIRGTVSDDNAAPSGNGTARVLDSILDLIRNMIPPNIVQATFQKTAMKFKYKEVKENETVPPEIGEQVQNWTNNITEVSHFIVIDSKEGSAGGTNLLGLITFSILFGFAVHSLGPDASVLADVFHAVRRVCVYLVSLVIWLSPLGILSLIAAEIADTEKLDEQMSHLSLYVATVLSTLFVHGVIVLPLLLYFFTRRNPIKFAYNMLQALMCAVGTASSTATLPCTIRCLEGRNQIDPRVTRFMLPLGTSINMDGTALYQAIAVVYIAQITSVTLSPDQILLIGLTAALASMAAASMPSAGMLTMAMVIAAVDLPEDKIRLLYPVDWFLDRFRTMVNVFSDSVGAAIVSKLCEHKLAEIPCDPTTLPNVDDNILDLPGGLVDVDLDGTSSIANGQLRRKTTTCSVDNRATENTAPACIYVVDDETIVLKF